MERKQLIIGGLLTLLSVLVSCAFIFYGAGAIYSKEVPKWIFAFAVVTIMYGICSLGILVLAWQHYGSKSKKLIGYLAIVFMAVFFLGSLDVGRVSGLEIVGLLVVGLMLYINWFAVCSVVKYKNVA